MEDVKTLNEVETSLMKEQKQQRRRRNARDVFTLMLAIISACAFMAVTVFAKGDIETSTIMKNVRTTLEQVIGAIGGVIILIGVYFLARSMSSQDPSQKAHAIETIAGGGLMVIADVIYAAVTAGTKVS